MAESYRDRWSNARWRDIEFLTDSHVSRIGQPDGGADRETH